MVNDDDLVPRPDYWNSLIWKRLMGTGVFDVSVAGDNSDRLRVYAHTSAADEPGSVTVLAINIDPQRDANVSFPGLEDRDYDVYRLNAPDILGTSLLLNDNPLVLQAGDVLPEIHGEPHRGSGVTALTLHPLSYAFITFAPR
jgi:hypothetical protein